MKKYLVFALVMFVLFLPSCKSPLTPEEAASVILEGEKARIPLRMQEYNLTNLTVDSIQFLNTEEPLSALLYTTWTFDETLHRLSFYGGNKKTTKTQSVIISITDICRSQENSHSIEWYNNWNDANWKIKRDVYDW